MDSARSVKLETTRVAAALACITKRAPEHPADPIERFATLNIVMHNAVTSI